MGPTLPMDAMAKTANSRGKVATERPWDPRSDCASAAEIPGKIQAFRLLAASDHEHRECHSFPEDELGRATPLAINLGCQAHYSHTRSRRSQQLNLSYGLSKGLR
jgi:hypothetical protein